MVEEISGITGGVVVGTDVSAGGRAALRFAFDEARRRGAPLHVVRAWSIHASPRPADVPFGIVPSLREYEEAVRAELDVEVAEVLGPDILDGDVVVHRHVVHGNAASALIDASAHADLVGGRLARSGRVRRAAAGQRERAGGPVRPVPGHRRAAAEGAASRLTCARNRVIIDA